MTSPRLEEERVTCAWTCSSTATSFSQPAMLMLALLTLLPGMMRSIRSAEREHFFCSGTVFHFLASLTYTGATNGYRYL